MRVCVFVCIFSDRRVSAAALAILVEQGDKKVALQHTATHCNTLQHTATHCNTLQHTATHCNTHTATHCKCVAVCCSGLYVYMYTYIYACVSVFLQVCISSNMLWLRLGGSLKL